MPWTRRRTDRAPGAGRGSGGGDGGASPALLARGFAPLIAAQFCSALADNALVIVAIAWLAREGLPPWWAPLLKLVFTLAYVVLAPGVGPLADAWPKARVMMATNALKIVGVLALPAGLGPLAAMAVVGLGAAAYSPAKYGLVTELVPPQRLVAANGWIEASTVAAVLLGTGVGGLLVSAAFHTFVAVAGAGSGLAFEPGAWAADPLMAAVVVLVALYALAALLNLFVPASGARYARGARRPGLVLVEFLRAQRTLWRDAEGGLSLAVTTLFWGAAATLQFALLRWAGEHLGLALDRAAYLQACVAFGVVAGAALAGRWVPLTRAPRMLPLGLLLGLMTPLLARIDSVALALPMLLVAGALGGALLVPMNALLQHRGHVLLSAGRSIAVQNFAENASVLAMLAVYAALTAFDVAIVPLLSAAGLVMTGAVALLMRHANRRLPWSRAQRRS